MRAFAYLTAALSALAERVRGDDPEELAAPGRGLPPTTTGVRAAAGRGVDLRPLAVHPSSLPDAAALGPTTRPG